MAGAKQTGRPVGEEVSKGLNSEEDKVKRRQDESKLPHQLGWGLCGAPRQELARGDPIHRSPSWWGLGKKISLWAWETQC